MIKNLSERIKLLTDVKPLHKYAIKRVESVLNIKLPSDFKCLSQLVNYEYLSNINFFNFELEGEYSVIGETLGYRQNADLPHRYLVLAEDDASVIFLETKENPDQETPIIWCALEDAYNICREKEMEYQHRIFPSFQIFFKYLLEEEEKSRQAS